MKEVKKYNICYKCKRKRKVAFSMKKGIDLSIVQIVEVNVPGKEKQLRSY